METDVSVEITLQVRSLENSVRFYVDCLDFVAIAQIMHSRRLVALRLRDSVIKLVEDKLPLENSNPRVSHHDRVYGFYALSVNVSDAAAIVETCQSLGYEVDEEFAPFPPGVRSRLGGGVATIRDPDGNFIELVQGLEWDVIPTEGSDQ